MYHCFVHRLEEESEKTSKNVHLKPFLETGFGGLAPEIRETLFINLLATPPPFGGRDFRVEQTRMTDRSPISLSTFVDLKASCLAVLQTCRQIYLEAFPIFYARKSYYLANSQEFATFLRFGGYLGVGPRLFRMDTITSLCLKDLIINRPAWTPQQTDAPMSRTLTLIREELQAERTNVLDPKLLIAGLKEMKSLRKICLCMRVGQEWEYLYFLFETRGLERGVIEFVDNFHWTIRSQNVLGHDWSLQYTAFPTRFFKRGKNFEMLSYDDISIQREVLKIDSRASDLVEGDERWVEVDIGSRNYEERLPEEQHAPTVPGQVSENQQGLPGGEGIDASTEDGSDQGSEDLQGQLDGHGDGAPMEDEPGQGSDDLQGQQYGEESDAQTENEHDPESDDLQGQSVGQNNDSENDDQSDQESSSPQNLTDDDDRNSQAESDTNQESVTLQGPPSQDYTGAMSESLSKGESEDLEDPPNTEDRTVSTATESTQLLGVSLELVDDRITVVRAQTDPAETSAVALTVENKDDLEAKPKNKTQSTGDVSSGTECEDHRHAQTQKEPLDSEYRNAETQIEPGGLPKDLQRENQMPTALSKNASTSDQDTVRQPKVRIGQQLSAQPKPKPSKEPQDLTKPQPEKPKSPQKPSNYQIPKQPKTHLAMTDTSTLKAERQYQPVPSTTVHIHGCVRAAALMLGLSLFYVVMYAKLENTLGQLLALLLFVLLFFVALWSEESA